jgi:hypothetical protein
MTTEHAPTTTAAPATPHTASPELKVVLVVRAGLPTDQALNAAPPWEQLTVLCLTETARRARSYEAYLSALIATSESDTDIVRLILAGHPDGSI